MARDSEISRRTVMKITGATAATALVAGCGGSDDDSGNGGDDDGNGGDTDGNGNGDDAIEPDTQIEFDGQTAGWVGIAPDSIADDQNPTITLQDGESYEIGWTTGDGSDHNIAIWNDSDEVVDDLATEETGDPGDGQWLEFEASSEMTQYVCELHEGTMIGDIEVV